MAIDPVTLGAAKSYTDKVIEAYNPDAYLGVTTTPLSDGSTTNPITINNKSVTAKSGQVAAYSDEEFIFDGTTWRKFGGTFAGLTDVNFVELEDGAEVKYNATSHKWENVNPPKIVTWADGTDEEIAAMLAAHYEKIIDVSDYWSVGDERVVPLSAISADGTYYMDCEAQNVTFVLSQVGGKTLSSGNKECAFQVDQKGLLGDQSQTLFMIKINSSGATTQAWKDCEARTWCNEKYYNALPSTFKSIIKEHINDVSLDYSDTMTTTNDKVAFRAAVEILGKDFPDANIYYSLSEGDLIDYYKTSSNQLKANPYDANSYNYWTRSQNHSNASKWTPIRNVSGNASCGETSISQVSGVATYFVI